MELIKDHGEVVMRPSEGERPALGRGIYLLAASYNERVQPIEVVVSVQIPGRQIELHYSPEDNRLRMDRGMDWFLSEGGETRFLRTLLRTWLDEARTRKADGTARRPRPSPVERAKHISER